MTAGSPAETTVFTIGHSTRTLEEFMHLISSYGVNMIVDVRTVPRSRHNSQFNKETFAEILKTFGIKYLHIKELGGFRRSLPDSINLALESRSFRGYADYMQTKEFTDYLLRIVALARENCLSIMCAEAVPWRCHRILLSDALLIRNIKVKHILTETSSINHELTPLAKVEGNKITYPLFSKEKPQRTLIDFTSNKNGF